MRNVHRLRSLKHYGLQAHLISRALSQDGDLMPTLHGLPFEKLLLLGARRRVGVELSVARPIGMGRRVTLETMRLRPPVGNVYPLYRVSGSPPHGAGVTTA